MYLKVFKTVERCGHQVQVKCCTEPTRAHCKGECIEILPCGHQCDKRCSEPCTQKCLVLVKSPVQAACGHDVQIPCYLARKGKNIFHYSKHEIALYSSVTAKLEYRTKGAANKFIQFKFL